MEHYPVTLPTVNLNGTAKQELLRQIVDVVVALQMAQGFMQRAAPHGRDYQTQDPNMFEKAFLAHTVRLTNIELLIREYEQIAQGIMGNIK